MRRCSAPRVLFCHWWEISHFLSLTVFSARFCFTRNFKLMPMAHEHNGSFLGTKLDGALCFSLRCYCINIQGSTYKWHSNSSSDACVRVAENAHVSRLQTFWPVMAHPQHASLKQERGWYNIKEVKKFNHCTVTCGFCFVVRASLAGCSHRDCWRIHCVCMSRAGFFPTRNRKIPHHSEGGGCQMILDVSGHAATDSTHDCTVYDWRYNYRSFAMLYVSFSFYVQVIIKTSNHGHQWYFHATFAIVKLDGNFVHNDFL